MKNTDTPSIERLKHCPFCGGEAGIDDFSTSYRKDAPPMWGVGCDNNKCIVEARVIGRDRDDSVRLWNTRATLETLPSAGEGVERELVTLADCPPGLFRFDGSYGFKSEYGAMRGKDAGGGKVEWSVSNWPDAYCLESGEYFWGGTSTHEARAKLLVEPLDSLPPTAALASPPLEQPDEWVTSDGTRPNLTCEKCGRRTPMLVHGLGFDCCAQPDIEGRARELLANEGPFTAGPCQIFADNDLDGAAVFSGDGQPFCLIDADTVVGGDPVPRAEVICEALNQCAALSLPTRREMNLGRGARAMRRTLDNGFDDEAAFRVGLIEAGLLPDVPAPPPQQGDQPMNAMFDLLEGLADRLTKQGDPRGFAMKAGYARGTGGVDVPYLIEVLCPPSRPSFDKWDYAREVLDAAGCAK